MRKAFVNANIIDVMNKTILKGYSILCEDGLIKSIDKDGYYKDCEIIDLKDAYLTAGLFNCHTHISSDCTVEGSFRGVRSEEELASIALANAKKLIETGFTFIRDVGTHKNTAVELMNAVNEGRITYSPDIVAATNPICITGGTCSHAFGYEADGPEACKRAAELMVSRGGKIIKLMATGGVMTPGSIPGAPQMSEEEMRACCEVAHKYGLKATAHAEGIKGTLDALHAGIDCIEHGDELDDECVAYMVEHHIPLIGTVSTCDVILSNMDNADPDIVRKSLESNERVEKSWAKAYKAGVLCGCGSDAGTAFTPFEQSNMEIIYLSDKHKAGSYEALKIATISSAIICGVEDTLGTVEVGKKAHFAVFKNNPIEDINNIKDCIMTIKNGEVLYSKNA